MFCFKHISNNIFGGDGRRPLSFAEAKVSHNNVSTMHVGGPVSSEPDYLAKVAAMYFCRWNIAIDSENVNKKERIPLDTANRAFYASIPADASIRNSCVRESALTDLQKRGLHLTCCSSATDSCLQGTMIHNWERDAFQIEDIRIRQRRHILIHYSHPCPFGKIELEAVVSVPAKTTEKVTEDDTKIEGAAIAGHDRLMKELRAKLADRKKTWEEETSGAKLTEMIDSTRKKKIEKARKRVEKDVQEKRRANNDACTHFIEKATSHKKGWLDAKIKKVEPEEDSDTFSSSSEEDDKKVLQKKIVFDYTESSEEKEEEEEEIPEIPEIPPTPPILQTIVSPPVQEKKFVKQTPVELLIPICEHDDTFKFFHLLECGYIMQWGNTERTRIHLFRRIHITESSWYITSSSVPYFELIVTIEVL